MKIPTVTYVVYVRLIQGKARINHNEKSTQGKRFWWEEAVHATDADKVLHEEITAGKKKKNHTTMVGLSHQHLKVRESCKILSLLSTQDSWVISRTDY